MAEFRYVKNDTKRTAETAVIITTRTEMNTMMNTMIPLTIANTLDQTNKQRIEAKASQSLKAVIQEQKLAPAGQFDVYDQSGKVISNDNAAQHRDSTVYVGVAKVAGGAPEIGFDLDDDDDDGWDLDADDDLIKPREVIFILQDEQRIPAQPNDGELLIQTYERVVGRPRDNSPMEISDGEGNIVSSRLSKDMVGRSFRVHLRAFEGGGWLKGKKPASHGSNLNRNPLPFPAKVPKEIIEQTTAFTQPRGRLEMGGLLIGHVDHEGNNVVICGFFPRQDQASSGYCEFHGSFSAIAAAACDYANEKAGGAHTPNLRVIGWIHTHPDIGIFLSGIDVNTFRSLRTHSFEQRCVAVVVDPLRQEHGVFTSEKNAQNKHAGIANDKIKLSEDLQARYHKLLNRLRTMQTKKGKEEIPFILPGVLYQQRVAMGDVDDIMEAKLQTLDKLNRQVIQQQGSVSQLQDKVRSLENTVTKLTSQIESCGSLKHGLATEKSRIDTLASRDEILKKMIEKQGQEIKQLKENSEIYLEALNQAKEKENVQEEE